MLKTEVFNKGRIILELRYIYLKCSSYLNFKLYLTCYAYVLWPDVHWVTFYTGIKEDVFRN